MPPSLETFILYTQSLFNDQFRSLSIFPVGNLNHIDSFFKLVVNIFKG